MALMSVTIVLLLFLFILLFAYGDKLIFRWMGHSISVDIQTLSAIRSGHFSSTRAGQKTDVEWLEKIAACVYGPQRDI